MRPLAILLSLLLLAPFGALVGYAVTGDAAASTTAGEWPFVRLVGRSLLRSLANGLAVSLLTGVIGAGLAVAVCFLQLPGRRLLQRLLILPLLLPTFAVAAIYRQLWSGFDSSAGLVLASTLTLYPYVYLLGRISLERHGGPLLELGSATGLDRRCALRRLVLPFAGPALLIGMGLVFLETVSDWATAATLSLDTGAVALHDLWFARDRPHLASRIGLGLVLLLVVALWLARRRVVPSHYRYLAGVTSTDGPNATPTSALTRLLVVLSCSIPIGLGFAVPVSWALRAFLRTIDRVDLSALAWECAGTVSLIAAVTALAVMFSILLTAAQRRVSTTVVRWTMWWMSASYGLPAIVLALGVLILTGAMPFWERYSDVTSFAILTVALSLRFLCLLWIPLQLGVLTLPRDLDELGGALQLSPRRTFLRLHLPQLRSFLLIGALLTAVLTLKETSMTVVLRPFSFEPIALRIYSLVRIDMLPESAAWILALVLVGSYPLLTLEGLLTGKRTS